MILAYSNNLEIVVVGHRIINIGFIFSKYILINILIWFMDGNLVSLNHIELGVAFGCQN